MNGQKWVLIIRQEWVLRLVVFITLAAMLTSLFPIPARAGAAQQNPGDMSPQGFWTVTGSLGAPRLMHASAALEDGSVLVAGGYGTAGNLASAELYDPATGSWSFTGEMGETHANFTLTTLANGKVLAVGGYRNDNPLPTAELYDPLNKVWTPTGGLSAGRANHTATRLLDGTVLVAGGRQPGVLLSSAERYDPASGTWSPAGNMNSPRVFHSASLLPDGRVLVVGGCTAAGSGTRCGPLVAGAEIYDPGSNTWNLTGSPASGRAFHSAVTLANGKVLVAGGCSSFGAPYGACGGPMASAEIYDPETGEWRAAPEMSAARDSMTLTLMADGKALAAGGCSVYNLNNATCTTAPSGTEIYDPVANAWNSAGTMSTGRAEHTDALLQDGRVLVAGGLANGISGSAEIYTVSNPPARRTHVIAILSFDNNLSSLLTEVVERFRQGTAANPDVTATLLVDGAENGDTRPLEVSQGVVTTLQEASFTGELDTSSPEVIANFLTWARQRHPDDLSVVALLGHGVGPTPEVHAAPEPKSSFPPLPSRRDFTPSDVTSGTYLSTPELGRALKNATQDGAHPFDVLFLDSCFEGSLDVLYEIRPTAQIFIASPSYAWAGFFYDRYLPYFTANVTGEVVAQTITSEYEAALDDGHPNVIFWVRQADVQAIARAVSSLGEALKAAKAREPWGAQAILEASLASRFVDTTLCAGDLEQCPPDELIGAGSFANNLRQHFQPTDPVSTAAGQVLDALARVNRLARTGHPWVKPEVTWTYDDALTILAPLTPTLESSLAWRYTIYTQTVPLQAQWAPVPTQTVTINTPLAFTVDGQWDNFIADWYGPVDPIVGAWCNVYPEVHETVVTPTLPITLTAQGGFDNIRLDWNAASSPEVTSYRIQRAPQGSDDFQTIATETGLTFFDNDSSLVSGQTYCYRVQALLPGEVGADLSNVACAVFGQVELVAQDSWGSPGEDAIVPILIRNAQGLTLAAADIWLDYNSNILEPVAVSNTALTAGYVWAFTANSEGDHGRAKISAAAGSAPTLYGEGALFWITFHITATDTTTSPLDLQDYLTGVGGTRIYAPSPVPGNPPVPVALTLQDGVFHADCHYRLGDITGDCTVDSGDAYLALWFSANPQTPPSENQLRAGDVNGNGAIDAGDADMILYYATHGTWPVLVAAQAARAEAPQGSSPVVFSLGAVTGAPGAEVDVPLTVQNASGMSGAEWVIAYDPDLLTGLSVKASGLGAGLDIQAHDDGHGLLYIAMASTVQLSGGGQLAAIHLHIAAGAQVGTSTPLALAGAHAYDLYGREFTTSALQIDIQRNNGQVNVAQQTTLRLYLPAIIRR